MTYQQGSRGQQQPRPQLTEEDRSKIEQIIVRADVTTLVEYAHRLGGDLQKKRLTTAQVRGFFGTVRQIEAEIKAHQRRQLPESRRPQPDQRAQNEDLEDLPDAAHRKLVLLKPRLAYQAQREGEGMHWLKEVLVQAITLVGRDSRRFSRFVEFFEAILAYHKAEGGT